MRKNRFRDFLDRARHGTGRPPLGSVAPSKRDHLLTMETFRDLPPEQITMIEHATVMRTIPKGHVIYSQEDRAEALFLLNRGRVSLYRLASAGKRLELATIGPKAFFGEMPLLGESLRHVFAAAAEESLLCVMSRADVERRSRAPHPAQPSGPGMSVRYARETAPHIANEHSQHTSILFRPIVASATERPRMRVILALCGSLDPTRRDVHISAWHERLA